MEVWLEGKTQKIKLQVLDKEGQPVDVDTAILYYYRPSDKNLDGKQPLQLAGKAGSYEADFSLPLKGKWDLIMEVEQGDIRFNMGRSIMVQDPE